MSYYLDEKSLIGEQIKNFLVDENKESATLTLLDGRKFRYYVDGDCCSYSWIEHITVPTDIEGAKLLEVKEGDSVDITDEGNAHPNEDHPYGYESLLKYQTSFVTDKGEIIFEYRNSSNGYYGGYMSGPSEIK